MSTLRSPSTAQFAAENSGRTADLTTEAMVGAENADAETTERQKTRVGKSNF